MEDLTKYGEQELSLRVFNDENLYLMRHNEGFITELKEIFKFNGTQETTLLIDLEEDLNELVKGE
jgi:hypothetical protein